MKRIFAVAIAAMLAITCQANADTVIYSNNFDAFVDGNLVGQGGWLAHSGAGSNPIQVAGGTIALDGTGEDANEAIGSVMGAGEIWQMSFDVTVSGVGGGSTYFAHMKTAGSGFNGRVFALSPVAGGDFTFGISEGSSSSANFATDFSFGTRYNVESTYNYDTGLSTLSIDGGPAITSVGADIAQAMEAVAFRQGGGGGSFVIDNVSVTSIMAIPEPGSLAILSLVTIGLVSRRRK